MDNVYQKKDFMMKKILQKVLNVIIHVKHVFNQKLECLLEILVFLVRKKIKEFYN